MPPMFKIMIIHGPNLNLLGQREPDLYGEVTLPELDDMLQKTADTVGLNLTCFQSNAEHEVINTIHRAYREHYDFIIINPAAYSHTSIAIRDALLAIEIPFIEVHISNIAARESFRHHSYLADIAHGVIYGLGTFGYDMALQAAHLYLLASEESPPEHEQH